MKIDLKHNDVIIRLSQQECYDNLHLRSYLPIFLQNEFAERNRISSLNAEERREYFGNPKTGIFDDDTKAKLDG